MTEPKTHLRLDPAHRSRLTAEQLTARLLQHRFPAPGRPLLIAIGGPGGTGKSTFAAALHALLPGSALFPLDDYKTPRAERADKGLYGAHPDANHIALARSHLLTIRAGAPVERPLYSIDAGAATSTTPYHPAPYNLIDGEISTYPQFRDLIDFSIFIDSDWTTQLHTRVTRDIDARGASREKAIATFLQSNLREFAEHGADSKDHADIHLYCSDTYHLQVEAVRSDWNPILRDISSEFDPIELSGLVVPVITPFQESGDLHEAAFISHLEWLARAGISRILVNGTTGEFFSLTAAERRRMFLAARRYFPGMILYQAGRESLRETREEMQWAVDHGAEGLLLLPPYFYAGVNEDGLIAYFTALAATATVPIILYNFPRHAGLSITPRILAEVDPFGLKDSSGTLDLLSHTPRYFVGSEGCAVEAFAGGAIGMVSGLANALPELAVELVSCHASGDREGMEACRARLAPVLSACDRHDPLRVIKALVSFRNPAVPATVRLPLVALPPADAESLRTLLENAGVAE